MTKSLTVLAQELTDTYASDRTVILLDGILSFQTFAFSVATITTPLAHRLVVGSRIRFTTTGTLPTPLTANTDYFALTTPTTTTLTISATLGGSAISLTAGSGAQTYTEQFLSAEDSISVLVNHEISHPNYARSIFAAGTCVANFANNDARSPDQFKILSPVSPNGALSYRYILLVRGGSLIRGNTTGDRHQLNAEPLVQTIAQGENKNILLRVRRSN